MCSILKRCLVLYVKINLSLLNIAFLLLGITIIALTSLLRWGDFNWFHSVQHATVRSIFDGSSLNIVSFALLVLGGLMVLLGIIGLIGVCCTNKGFLVFYEVIVGALFAIHFGLFIFVVVKYNAFEEKYREALKDVIESVNSKSNLWFAQCEALKLLSTVFTCCGNKGPNDFFYNSDKDICCKDYTEYSSGCGDITVSYAKKNFAPIFVIPNVVLITVESIIFIYVIFLIRRIGQSRKSLSLDN